MRQGRVQDISQGVLDYFRYKKYGSRNNKENFFWPEKNSKRVKINDQRLKNGIVDLSQNFLTTSRY